MTRRTERKYGVDSWDVYGELSLTHGINLLRESKWCPFSSYEVDYYRKGVSGAGLLRETKLTLGFENFYLYIEVPTYFLRQTRIPLQCNPTLPLPNKFLVGFSCRDRVRRLPVGSSLLRGSLVTLLTPPWCTTNGYSELSIFFPDFTSVVDSCSTVRH